LKLSEAKTKAIKLINEYSNNGGLISAAQNADYLNRMNDLANDAQMEICEQIGIQAVTTYTQTEERVVGYNKYALPADWKSIRYVRLDDEPYTRFRIENNKFIVFKRDGGTFELSYYRKPTTITSSTPDTYDFEIDENAQPLIPYYIGGMVIADENDDISSKLLNLYFTRLANMEQKNEKPSSSVRNGMGW
jgi:hypothetical protein